MQRNQYQAVGVTLPTDMLAELDKLAADRGISRAETIRAILNVGLPFIKVGLAVNARRTLAILEHTQLALSFLMEKDHPEDAAELLRLAFQNVDAHHG